MLVVGRDLPDPARLFIWWLLCMIFASLRFDDALHVKPDELKMQDEGLFGVAWQVDRKRTGTRFIVPSVGFKDSTWLQVGWQLLQDDLCLSPDRDYWIQELNTRDAFSERPPTHQRTVKWLQFFSGLVVETLALHSGSKAYGHRSQALCRFLSSYSPRCCGSCGQIYRGDRLASELEGSWTASAQVHQKSLFSPRNDDQAVGARSDSGESSGGGG